MSVAGIIAEYDPFHNGHLLHLRETKAFSPDGVVVVLGGNFTQRGAPAAFPKRVRAKMALAAGAQSLAAAPLLRRPLRPEPADENPSALTERRLGVGADGVGG